MSLARRSIPSPNYSSRSGAKVRLIVLHTAEGARTIEELGSFFANPSSGVSSHVGIDDTPATVGEYVQRGSKAWTAANANPVAVQAELCAFADWTTAQWNAHPAMLENVARWIAEEARAFDLPIVKLTPAQAQGSGRGVCEHVDLGAWGGGHWDCGTGFPIEDVLELATDYFNGGGEDVGYPAWFWDWSRWYLTTSRDADERPDAAPTDIPQWAWDGLEEVEAIGKRYGMTSGERDWIDWRAAGMPEDERPHVPTTIPDRWWTDNEYVVARTR